MVEQIAKQVKYLLIPVIGIITGLLLTYLISPSQNFIAYVYSFMAGLVLAVISTELVPNIVSVTASVEKLSIIIGFLAGMILLLVIRSYVNSKVRQVNLSKAEDLVPWQLVISISIDFFINSFLIGLVSSIGESIGISLGVILTIEMIILTIGLSQRLKNKEISKASFLWLILLTSIIILFGVTIGYTLGKKLHRTPFYYGLLSFGIAVLLWLVVEELLIYTREVKNINTDASIFLIFSGFLVIIILSWLIPS